MEELWTHVLLNQLLWERVERGYLNVIQVAVVMIKMASFRGIQLTYLADGRHSLKVANNKVFVRLVSACLDEHLLTVEQVVLTIDRASPREGSHHGLGLG